MSVGINGTVSGIIFEENPAVIGWVTGVGIFIAGCIFAVLLGVVIVSLMNWGGARGVST